MAVGDNSQITGVSTFTLDHLANRDTITIPNTFTACHKVSIWETDGTTRYTLGRTNNHGDPGITYPPGYVKEFKRAISQAPFQPGEILCYGEIPTGTITFNIMGEEEYQ